MKRLELISRHLSFSREICIVALGRSAIHKANGELKDIKFSDLAGQTIRGLLDKYSIESKHIEEFYMGSVYQANLGQSPCKQAAVSANLPDSVSCANINKLCASGMKAIMLGCLSILEGNSQCVLAGGVELMSNYPYLISLRNGIQTKVRDTLGSDVLADAITKELGITIADIVSKGMNFTKQELDDYAIISCNKANEAKKLGKFKSEIIDIKQPKTNKLISEDFLKTGEAIKNSKAIYKDGTTSVGNACGLNDGASFIVLASREKAIREKWKVLGTIVSFADAEQESRKFPLTPALAIEKALRQANLPITSIDYMELNEPFSCVVLGNSKLLNFPVEKINVYGGALSMGHPVGSSGSRIVGTLVNVLNQENGNFGVAGICNGAGGASAIIIKKEN